MRPASAQSTDHDGLVLRHHYLVASVLRTIRHLPRLHEDLLQEGFLGLVRAARRWDPSRGVSFPSYAGRLIRGAILDSMRAFQPNAIAPRRRAMELARAAGETLRVPVYSLSEPITDDLELGDLLPDRSPSALGDCEARDHIAHLLARLPARTRLAACLYHGVLGYDPMPMREIAHTLGISESRVSQLLSWATRKLRVRIPRPRGMTVATRSARAISGPASPLRGNVPPDLPNLPQPGSRRQGHSD